MHRITGRLVNIAEEMTRTEKPKPYKVLQLMVDQGTLTHRIKGEVLTSKQAKMDGMACNAIQLMCNGARYHRIEHVVDYQVERKLKKGVIEVYGRPVIKNKNGKPFCIFELNEDQEQYPPVPADADFKLLQVKDYKDRNWKIGEVEIAVNYRAWKSASGSGLNYLASEEQ